MPAKRVSVSSVVAKIRRSRGFRLCRISVDVAGADVVSFAAFEGEKSFESPRCPMDRGWLFRIRRGVRGVSGLPEWLCAAYSGFHDLDLAQAVEKVVKEKMEK